MIFWSSKPNMFDKFHFDRHGCRMYLPTEQYPQGGKMSVGFHQLVVGDTVELKGPLGSFVWNGKGMALWKGVERRVKNIGLICAGSGKAPRWCGTCYFLANWFIIRQESLLSFKSFEVYSRMRKTKRQHCGFSTATAQNKTSCAGMSSCHLPNEKVG